MLYVINRTMVGAFPQGRVVSEEQLNAAGADINYLKNDGAILPAPKDASVSSEPLPVGPKFNPGDPQHAALASEMAKTTGSAKSASAEGTDELDDMTKDQLLEIAESEGVDEVKTSMTKAEILSAIRDHRGM